MKKLDHIEVIKDIPGYKMILKAVLKTQIQQLVKANNNLSLPKFRPKFFISWFTGKKNQIWGLGGGGIKKKAF